MLENFSVDQLPRESQTESIGNFLEMFFNPLIIFAVLGLPNVVLMESLEPCQFVRFLKENLHMEKAEIYKHYCVVSLHLMNKSDGEIYGIYRISSKYWCNDGFLPGMDCSMHCSDLLDDDITDDVACAKIIMNRQGVNAFKEKEETCRARQKTVDFCLNDTMRNS
jgi:hypothetical protein